MNLHRISTAPRSSVLAAIGLYQRHLSPRKGFTCAHLVAHGGRSCSAAVAAIIADLGIARGLLPILTRFLACARAAADLRVSPALAQGVCCCGGIPIPFRF